MRNSGITFDQAQRAVIDADRGYHLVLAPPGCGKTQILSQRVVNARQRGYKYEEMLCLTFTNRASRGMLQRIKNNCQEDISKLFIGNVHRYCARFLYNENLLPSGSTIMDEVDTSAIIMTLCMRDELYFDRIIKDYLTHAKKKKEKGDNNWLAAQNDIVNHILQVQHIRKQECLNVPDELINRNEYDQARTVIRFCGEKAEEYMKFKEENLLLDFEDILIYSYWNLRRASENNLKTPKYRWIQVDEVQDLNPLQLAIVDLITDKDEPTVLYLGDEQQAIFSFMGAKLSTLEKLKKRCGDNIHFLGINYRSPKYLLDIFNAYARDVLNVAPALLPTPYNSEEGDANDLIVKHYDTQLTLLHEIAKPVNYYLNKDEDGKLAIIVRTNNAADEISGELGKHNISHIKVSGKDIFQQDSVKLLMSHMSLIANELNTVPWTNVLMAGQERSQDPKLRWDIINFLFDLKSKMLTPDDFIRYNGSSYVAEFCKAYRNREIVVFDTETTGLNIYEDDVVQIAAVKVRNGSIVPNSEFDIILKTDREIPLYLGDLENPLVREYQMREHKYDRKEGLQAFCDYIGDDAVLVGHNIQYDRNILINNLRREGVAFDRFESKDYFDSLRLARIIKPNLRSYKLKDLLEMYHLYGANSHLASDDIVATKSLLDFCYSESDYIVQEQIRFMNYDNNKKLITKLRSTYSDLYLRAKENMYARNACGEEGVSAFTANLVDAYLAFREEGLIRQPPEKFGYIKNFIEYYLNERHEDLTNLSLHEILESDYIDISTFKEADFIESGLMDERVVVITVHKAKGLEFDNVIVSAAIEGQYPSYFSLKHLDMRKKELAIQEDARLFYVAMSRARKRLCFTTYHYFMTMWGNMYPQSISRFLIPVLSYFTHPAL
jgi:DNA helicase-2/ATP-dependent DNA helicase PcrA